MIIKGIKPDFVEQTILKEKVIYRDDKQISFT